ncbi:DUF6192 family protein [Streptomyces cyaneochromogenes]|uniref:DUF6192 family protein n=1 Tax=Streptomyces cyaneochromogenes TaxID=2496836 RepID=UPI001E5FEC8C|nr:DUF6192 family protein [Streptomyces cyaneochromogenes]
MSYCTVKQARQTASKWPKDRRVAEVSFTVHNILASIADDEERFAAILTPPLQKEDVRQRGPIPAQLTTRSTRASHHVTPNRTRCMAPTRPRRYRASARSRAERRR